MSGVEGSLEDAHNQIWPTSSIGKPLVDGSITKGDTFRRSFDFTHAYAFVSLRMTNLEALKPKT